MFNGYLNIVRTNYQGGHHGHSPAHFIKETLIGLGTFGYGNKVIDSSKSSSDLFERFEEILRVVLPPSLGFKRLHIRIPEVVLSTSSGDFSLDAVSGGIASLIDIAWQIFMYEPTDSDFAVTIDEPENHLHPELQRTVLTSLLTAFPQAQFICATHNPFIVTSVPDSTVYVMRYDDKQRVSGEVLRTADRSGTSNEVLRDVLGLDSTSPLWVEKALQELVRYFAGKELNESSVEDLRSKLAELGLAKLMAPVLARLIEVQSE
jgi:hypothetical protein